MLSPKGNILWSQDINLPFSRDNILFANNLILRQQLAVQRETMFLSGFSLESVGNISCIVVY